MGPGCVGVPLFSPRPRHKAAFFLSTIIELFRPQLLEQPHTQTNIRKLFLETPRRDLLSCMTATVMSTMPCGGSSSPEKRSNCRADRCTCLFPNNMANNMHLSCRCQTTPLKHQQPVFDVCVRPLARFWRLPGGHAKLMLHRGSALDNYLARKPCPTTPVPTAAVLHSSMKRSRPFLVRAGLAL